MPVEELAERVLHLLRRKSDARKWIEMPETALLLIATFLGVKSSSRMALVCKVFNRVMLNPFLWRTFCETRWKREDLNSFVYTHDYKKLYQDRNGWDKVQRCNGNYIRPKATINLNFGASFDSVVPYCNIMDIRADRNDLFIVGDSVRYPWVVSTNDTHFATNHTAASHQVEPRNNRQFDGVFGNRMLTNAQYSSLRLRRHTRDMLTGAQSSHRAPTRQTHSSHLRIVDFKNDLLQEQHVFPTQRINCLDVMGDLYACGDYSAQLNVFNRSKHENILTHESSLNLDIESHLEINDLRIANHPTAAIAYVVTSSRRPAGLRLLDLTSQKDHAVYPDTNTADWIHSVDIDASRRSTNELVVSSENFQTGRFRVGIMDLRLKHKFALHHWTGSGMACPVRQKDNYIVVNCLPNGAAEKSSTLLQLDIRYNQTIAADSALSLGVSRFSFPEVDVRDLQVHEGHVHIAAVRNTSRKATSVIGQSQVDLLRYPLNGKSGLHQMHSLSSSDNSAKPLLLLHCHPNGLFCSHGKKIHYGHII